jgi:hypothetical protein
MSLGLFRTFVKLESMIRCINPKLLNSYIVFNLLNTKKARGKVVNC